MPKPHGLCADVYELRDYGGLPDFRELDPVGTLYADYLLIPNQQSPRPCSLPGVTCDSSFGLDYHGAFWVRTPGEYQFELTSDDGAVLQIDDTQVIKIDGKHPAVTGAGHIVLAAGRHTMHLPYFEDGLGLVMLELWVRPPGGDWRVFNMQDFAPPSGDSQTNSQTTQN
ncbi:PA14 domain-containing protein [Occallatibacter savannae]|uniref:PA14 domain-containing protein n=1 Tax=Occallatibacter savannae TaxID=1002691 RepID=UPI00194DAFA1|nr:PA14 domain-containing protein [Occallatibacter savannae]